MLKEVNISFHDFSAKHTPSENIHELGDSKSLICFCIPKLKKVFHDEKKNKVILTKL